MLLPAVTDGVRLRNAIINKCEDPFNDECPCELKLNGVLQLIGAGAFLSEMLVDVEESFLV